MWWHTNYLRHNIGKRVVQEIVAECFGVAGSRGSTESRDQLVQRLAESRGVGGIGGSQSYSILVFSRG